MSTTDLELQNWVRSAPHWSAHADRIAAMTSGVTAGLLRRLRPAPGQRLLDVAAGTGDPSLRLAELVGPSGEVLATDGVPGMLETLAQRAAARGLRNLRTLHVVAEQLDLPAASFDGACSRFGVMFFADAARAAERVRRALRPGGRLVLAAWGARDENPYFTLPNATFEELGLPDPAPAGARTVFECSAPGRLAGLLADAGFADVQEDRVRLRLPLPDTPPEHLLDRLTELSHRVAERTGPLDAATRARLAARLAQHAAPFARDGGLDFPAEVVFTLGRA
jgi:SAM-dependent methyltransferase